MPRFVVGALLVVIGGALILAQLGVVSVDEVTQYWPAALVLLGLSMLQPRDGRVRPFGAILLIIVGSWLLLKTLGLIQLDPWEFLGPLVLVAIGARIMLRRSDRGNSASRTDGHTYRSQTVSSGQLTAPGDPSASTFASGQPASGHDEVFAILGGCQRRWSNTVFSSISATSIMGGSELDLREALMGADGTAHIELFAVMGGFSILVPPSWTVVLRVTPILGGVEDKTHTVSSNARLELVIHGTVIMGGIEISN